MRVTAAVTLALACVAGCGSGTTVQPADDAAVAPAGAAALAGLWHLTAAGEPDGAILQLGGGDLTVIRPCVSVDGTWAARGGLFLADMPDELNRVIPHKGCPQKAKVAVPGWLASAVGYEPDGGGWRLLDARGSVVARLRPGAEYPADAPQGRVSVSPIGGTGDAVRPDSEERARLNATPAAPLPAGVRPAEPAELVGRWEPETRPSRCDRPYLDLRADGSWVGHDDDADLHGRWVAGEGGLALGTASESGGPGCGYMIGEAAPDPAEVAVDAWMLRLARLGVRGDELVLFDPDGGQLASLIRRQAPLPADDADDDGLADTSGDGHVEIPYTPPPVEPLREGRAVPGGTRYLVRTDEHQFYLASPAGDPDPERLSYRHVFEVDHHKNSAVLVTGCALGDVWVTVRLRTSAPGPLARSMDGWEVGEEETMTIRKPLWLSDLMGDYDPQKIFTPAEPGRHRVRVLAKGRGLQYDEVCDKPVEHYELTIWPVDKDTPRVRLGDDGV